MKKITLLLFCCLILSAANTLFAQSESGAKPAIPHFTSPVYDETNTLTPEQKAALERRLYYYYDSTSTQIQIEIISTTNGYPISDLATETAQQNKLGQAKKNNGALILISKNDRKAFIAPGYGLEPTLTDAACEVIFQNILKPGLQRGDFYGGLDSTVSAMMLVVAGEFHADQYSQHPLSIRTRGRSGGGVLFFVFLLFIVISVIRTIAGTGVRRTVVGSGAGGSGCLGGIMQGLFWSSIFSSGRGGGFGGGGFGGGGGGFGGWSGGGGSFGGGGAGGSW